MELTVYTFMGSLGGIIVVGRGERFAQFGQAAVAVSRSVNIAVVVAFAILVGQDVAGLVQLLGASVAAAIASAVAAAGTFALLGNVFGIATYLPAPGARQPAATAAPAAADGGPGHLPPFIDGRQPRRTGSRGDRADTLVARVSAYYHDVGKLLDPQAFIENQAGANIHDLLPPEESAAILAGHVAHGIDIAYEYKLPKALIGYIPQHHGTALMGYFYAKARQQAAEEIGAGPTSVAGKDAGDRVDQRRYRHAGPKPQTREAAILMLADSVEASVRSLARHDEPAIRAMVERIMSERLLDGQFDECDVTLRDLDRIRESFIRQLLAMYHRRIPYPTSNIVELGARRAAGRPGA